MSDHYLFNLQFDVRHDAPPQLHAALTRRAAGEYPTAEEVSDLPGIVRHYLRSGGAPGDGVYLSQFRGPIGRYRDGKPVEVAFEPHEGSHTLRMARTFHDDEYYNGGMFFIYWLYQFVAGDGPIGTMQQTNGRELPCVLTRAGDRIIETRLAFSPAAFWPMPGQAQPDPGAPVIVSDTTTVSLTETMAGLQIFADGNYHG